jgi:hypothetical protein
MVINKVEEPNLAEAEAASQPAWPAPTTITSYFLNKIQMFHVEQFFIILIYNMLNDFYIFIA